MTVLNLDARDQEPLTAQDIRPKKKKERENDHRLKLQHGGVGVGMRTVDLSKVHNCVVSSSSYHDPADKIFL